MSDAEWAAGRIAELEDKVVNLHRKWRETETARREAEFNVSTLLMAYKAGMPVEQAERMLYENKMNRRLADAPPGPLPPDLQAYVDSERAKRAPT